MNVFFYIPALTREYGGIYQYTLGLLSSLSKGKCNYYIFCLNPDNELKELVGNSSNLHFIEKSLTQRNRWRSFQYRLVCFLNNISLKFFNKKISDKDFLYDLIFEKYKINISHCPYTLFFKYKQVPNISTLHDVQELHFPAFFTSEQRASRAVNNKYIIDNSDAIIVSYAHIKNDIVKLFNKAEKQVYVCLIDMKNLWFEKFIGKKLKETDIKLPSNFLFFPAVMWQHKNHINLLKSIAWLRDNKKIEANIIFTGDDKIPFAKNVHELINELKLQEQVTTLGIVSDETLYLLYQKCKAVVVPTLYEAGSFPLMEAILMGKNVICSNVTSLPETIGDNKYVFDPTDVIDMAQKIEKIYLDETYQKENLIQIKKQQDRLKNTGVTQKVEEIYASLSMNYKN